MSTTASESQRMNWLDGARLAAAFCIIAIHTSTDSRGEAFKDYTVSERTFPVLFRALAEVASTEFYILLSLFLIAISLSKVELSYVDTMKKQARRLLVPFVAWTLFYVFFRLYKAHYIGYTDAILAEISSIKYWLAYFTLGFSNYHMHFLPTLFLLLLFHRIYKLAIVYPALGLIIIPFLYINNYFSGWIWSTVKDPILLEYCIRALKILTYTGYGFFAYSLFGIWKRGVDKNLAKTIFGFVSLLLAIGILIKLVYAYKVTQQGIFIHRKDLIYYGHYLFPCVLIAAFFSSQYFRWPESLSTWSKYTFGMYLVHPAIIDIIDMALLNRPIDPSVFVLFKYSCTAFLALTVSMLISRTRLLAWTIGLGPIPTTRGVFPRKAATVR